MRVYYDQNDTVTSVFRGEAAWAPIPDYAFIDTPDQDLGELGGLKVVGGAVVRADLGPVRRRAITRINDLAGDLRRTFITDLPGQEMLYLRKEAEAVSYVALNPEPSDLTDYPLMASEVGPGLTAPTAYQLAQIWLYMSAQWKVAAGQIETARLRAVYAVEAAASDAAIVAAYEGALP